MIPSMIAAAALGNASALPRISSATGPACVIVTGVQWPVRTRGESQPAPKAGEGKPEKLALGAG